MSTKKARHAELLAKYRDRKGEIESRLSHFESVGKRGGKALFEELSFCILTPQSKAFSCDDAIREMKQKNLLHNGSVGEIRRILAKKTRFHNKKADYLVLAREKFSGSGFASLGLATFSGSEPEARATLIKSVKGIGLKEASHYLRNVGRGRTIAILDRHILKNLKKHGAIVRLPKSLTPNRYLSIEKKMEKFCRETGIPMSHLDLLFWAEETGKIFK
jgi:N-glycosylase/DNA lyase